MFFELFLEHEICHFGELFNKYVGEGLLSADSELLGDCQQVSIALFKSLKRWGFQKLNKGFTHILNKHLFEFYSSQLCFDFLNFLDLWLHRNDLIRRLEIIMLTITELHRDLTFLPVDRLQNVVVGHRLLTARRRASEWSMSQQN